LLLLLLWMLLWSRKKKVRLLFWLRRRLSGHLLKGL
jgi:hypothetical protein